MFASWRGYPRSSKRSIPQTPDVLAHQRTGALEIIPLHLLGLLVQPVLLAVNAFAGAWRFTCVCEGHRSRVRARITFTKHHLRMPVLSVERLGDFVE